MTPFAAWKARPGRPTLVALLEASQGRVFAICQEILRHRQDAEEAAQETLLEILVGVDGVRDAEHYESWIKTVAFRTALDRKKLRSRRRLHELNGTNGNRREEAPFEGLHDALEKLGEEDRALLVERYFDRKTFDEMGRSRGLSDIGVRKRVAKAQDRLKRMLGCAIPSAFWKSAVSFGVAAMKTKTVAGVAVIILPLLLLGGGVFVASARRSATPVAGVSQPKTNPKIQTRLAESKDRTAPAPKSSEAIVDQKALPDRARIRAEVVTSLDRLRYVRRRSAECKELWPDASTEEEGRALQREKVALDAESGELSRSLRELAAQDPANIVDMVLTARDLPERLQLMGLIAPDVDAEFISEDGPCGPFLASLLSLALGDADERAHLAAFAGQLPRANRVLAQTLVKLMNDSDVVVRLHAIWSLQDLAVYKLRLKDFLAGQILPLRLAAVSESAVMDHHYRGCALRILAVLENDEADRIVLEQFENLNSTGDYARIEAAVLAGNRLGVRHEARLLAALHRAFALPFQEEIHGELMRLVYCLPESARAGIMPLAETRHPGPRTISTPNIIPIWGGRGASRTMTGVNRWGSGQPTERTVRRQP